MSEGNVFTVQDLLDFISRNDVPGDATVSVPAVMGTSGHLAASWNPGTGVVSISAAQVSIPDSPRPLPPEVNRPRTSPGDDYETDDNALVMKTVNDVLRRVMTDDGVEAWWSRPHPMLASRCPMDLWADDKRRPVYDAAYAALESVAT